ncbi:hypothetical protein ACLOJK_036512 [Asimina triloba]
MSPPPIYMGGAGGFLVGLYVCLRPATMVPPAAVTAAGRYNNTIGKTTPNNIWKQDLVIHYVNECMDNSIQQQWQ